MAETKKIDWTERLARLRQRRNPDGLDEKKLTTGARKALPKGNFVFAKDRRYPIPDQSHARNALARVSQHGSSAEKAKVRAAVHRKFPGIKQHEDMSGGGAEQTMAPLARLDPWTMNAVRQFAAHRMQLENPSAGQVDQTDINQWLYDFLQVHSFDDLMGEIKQATAGYFESFDPEAPLETYEFMGHTIELHHSAEGTGEANQYYAYIDGEYDDKTLADTPAQAKGNAEAVCHMLPRRGPVTFSPSGPVRHCGIVGQAEALVNEVLKRARGV